MRYFSLAILLTTLVIHATTAQSKTDSSGVKPRKGLLGFHVGITSTTLEGTQIDLSLNSSGSYQESVTGIDIAFDYKLEATSFFFIKSGAGLSTKKCDMIGTSAVYPLKAELKFFSIPLVVGFQVPNTSKVIVGVEGGLMANFDAGSTTNNSAGLHPDNTVVMESFVPSLVLGGSLEVKLNDNLRVFANYRLVSDLDDYYKRTYRVYDGTPSGGYTDYHYDFRITSSHVTFGVLFVPGR